MAMKEMSYVNKINASYIHTIPEHLIITLPHLLNISTFIVVIFTALGVFIYIWRRYRLKSCLMRVFSSISSF